MFNRAASLSALVCLTGCAALNLNSVPWAAYSPIVDEDTAQLFRDTPLAYPLRSRDNRSYDQDDLILGLSVSGGGSRAAAFTLGVLIGLEEMEYRDSDGRAVNGLELVDFASATSGGAWGIVGYLADRLDQNAGCGEYTIKSRMPEISAKQERTTYASPEEGRLMRFIDDLGAGKTFADIQGECVLDPYINITNMPAQSAFVMTQNYLTHFKVRNFEVGDITVPINQGNTRHTASLALDTVPLGFTAFVSGAVPGWYQVEAETELCGSTADKYDRLCGVSPKNDTLILQDGGMYDNYGYKSAFEVFGAHRKSRARKVLIQIDTTTNWSSQAQAKGQRPSFLQMARGASFPNQDATFIKTFKTMALNASVQPVVLDLFSTSGFDPDTQADLLVGLDNLTNYESKYGEVIDIDGDGDRNGYWRTGMLFKTRFDYRYDDGDGPENALVDLGILAVRMNAEVIEQAINGRVGIAED